MRAVFDPRPLQVRLRRILGSRKVPSSRQGSFPARATRAINISVDHGYLSSFFFFLFLIFNRYTANVTPLSLSCLLPFSFCFSFFFFFLFLVDIRFVSLMRQNCAAHACSHLLLGAATLKSQKSEGQNFVNPSHVATVVVIARQISRGINRLRRMAVQCLLSTSIPTFKNTIYPHRE